MNRSTLLIHHFDEMCRIDKSPSCLIEQQDRNDDLPRRFILSMTVGMLLCVYTSFFYEHQKTIINNPCVYVDKTVWFWFSHSLIREVRVLSLTNRVFCGILPS